MNDAHHQPADMNASNNLPLAELLVGDIVLRPIEYIEDVRDGLVMATALVLVSVDERDRLRSLMKSDSAFPVIRRGIDDQPLVMRFGVCGWSQHGQETKYQLTLVDQRYDDQTPKELPSIIDAEEANRRNHLAYRIELLEELTELLIAKGVLSQPEIDAARERAQQNSWLRRHSFLRVEDASQLGR